jgi:nitrite reductase/ring-hydroxylating ferredoxin subunit
MPHIDVRSDGLPEGRPLRLEHAGSYIVVIRSQDRIFAFPDHCPHAGWPLSEGQIHDGTLQCPGHGYEFTVATGECVTVPAYRLRCLAVSTHADTVRIEWDEPPSRVETEEWET